MFRKKITSISLGCFFLCLLPFLKSCQRDDICPEATSVTPMLNIGFFDIEEIDLPKPPVNLRIQAEDYDTIYANRINESVISLPLRTDRDITNYEFTINAPVIPDEGEEEVPGENTNMDVISFTYTREQVYINRACSYKVNYLDLRADLLEDENHWINNILISEENITNETDTIHIHIRH